MVSDAPVEVELDTSEVAGDHECSGGLVGVLGKAGDRECLGGLVGVLGEAGDCSAVLVAEDGGSESISVIFLPAMLWQSKVP